MLGALLGDKASAEGGCGEPACGAKHDQGLGAAPVLSDLLGPQRCAQRWVLPLGLRPAPKADFATGQPEFNSRANRRETPLIERPAHALCAKRCWMFSMQRMLSATAQPSTHALSEIAVSQALERSLLEWPVSKALMPLRIHSAVEVAQHPLTNCSDYNSQPSAV